MLRTLIIIPARYASSRFPGKPLADLLGRPMLWHVYEHVRDAADQVYVATDDERIFEAMKRLDVPVIMTGKQHRSGTDRCAEALDIIEQRHGQEFDIVVNVQGDEPLISGQVIRPIFDVFEREAVDIATLVRKEKDLEILTSGNAVKVVVDFHGNAIYFSRQMIPYVRDKSKEQWPEEFDYYVHVGIYAYRPEVLRKIVKLPQGRLERVEKLEQLRWLEHGYQVRVLKTDYEGIGVDTPEDLERVKGLMMKKGM